MLDYTVVHCIIHDTERALHSAVKVDIENRECTGFTPDGERIISTRADFVPYLNNIRRSALETIYDIDTDFLCS